MIHLDDHEVRPTIFPDGTSQIWKLPSDLLARATRITWRFQHEGEFMHLAQLSTLLSNRALALHLPYLPYGRQDKQPSNDATFALATFANLLNALGFAEVHLYDPHSPRAEEWIRRAIVHYFRAETLQAFADFGADVVCYPDDGARGKYTRIHPMPHVRAGKARDQATGEITGTTLLDPVAGRSVLIVDDICDGGRTFTELAKVLREAGARDVGLFVSHGLFTKGLGVLLDAGISRIFTPQGEQFRSEKTGG